MSARPSPLPGRERLQRRKLSDLIAEDLRRWIARERLRPGARLPNEKTLMEHYGCAKGTIREALKVLEVQGLVKMQTGPNGGAEIQPVSLEAVTQQLRSYLHFHALDFEQVYALRHSLEVTLAESVVGRLSDEQLARLEANIETCDRARERGDHSLGRQSELEFHDILCEACDNPLLAFICRFLNGLLRDLVEFRSDRYAEHGAFGQHNIDSHRALLAAFRTADRDAVRRIMAEHMHSAECFMRRLDAAIRSDLLSGD
ncbi:MAG TPA: FCD domain-containing protein [Nevskiales bacterium]|nr:FCD domain-containing protein [Nevskiales bacterium]